MSARIYRRGDTYWAAVNGQRVSLRTKDKVVGKARLRGLELGPHKQSERTLGEALNYLLDTVYAGKNADTVKSYRQKARWLIQEIGDVPIAAIDPEACYRYRAKRLEHGVKDHTIHKEVVVLRLALSASGIAGVVPEMKANYTPVDRFISLEVFRTIMDELPVKRRLWFMTACFAGCRDRELTRLRAEDIDVASGVARVRGTKTKGADRYVPIHPSLMIPLAVSWWFVRPTGPLIERWTNRRRDVTAAYWKVIGFDPGPNWSKGTARGGRSIKGAPRISPNDLRRTFISWLKQAGVDSLAAAKMAGTGVRMVERVYGQLNMDTYREAIRRLPGA